MEQSAIIDRQHVHGRLSAITDRQHVHGLLSAITDRQHVHGRLSAITDRQHVHEVYYRRSLIASMCMVVYVCSKALLISPSSC